jgi:hypothetical protein
MSEQAVEKVGGSGEVVKTTSGAIEGAPSAHTTSDSPVRSHIVWFRDPRPKTQQDTPRLVSPYWQISDYTKEEVAAIRKADELPPILAEHYKDLLDD